MNRLGLENSDIHRNCNQWPASLGDGREARIEYSTLAVPYLAHPWSRIVNEDENKWSSNLT